MKKIKVYFIVPTLYGGGAERITSYIPQFLNKDVFDTMLIVIGYEKHSEFEVSGIPVIFLNKSRVLNSPLKLIRIFFREKPNIVLGTLTHVNTILGFISLLFPKTKFIGRHCIVSQKTKKIKKPNRSLMGHLRWQMIKRGYKLLDIVLCQSFDMYHDLYSNEFDLKKERLHVINNPVRDDFQLKDSQPNSPKILNLITVARLVKMKGHDRLLELLSRLSIPYKYTIVGDGSERNEIFEVAKNLKILDNIEHVPYSNEVSKYLAQSDYYIMGSHAEGFPNCLLETCAVGTPAIAFKAPGGLNEIIEDGVNGYLVDNAEEFISKLQLPYNWKPEKVREVVFRKFNREKIIKDYENLFLNLINK